MAAPLSALVSYLPPLLAHRIVSIPPSGDDPARFSASGAVLFADIAGFSKLTERLASRGSEGIAQLTQILNRYFGELIEHTAHHGGEVVKFAGDALLARWPAEDHLQAAVERASACGLEVRARLNNLVVDEGIRLSLRMAIGAGTLFAARVGGARNRWELLLSGEPLQQIADTMPNVPYGTLVLTPEAARLAEASGVGTPLQKGGLILRSQRVSPEPRPLDLPPFTPDHEPLLRSCIPMAILDRLAADQDFWLAERRGLTVLFVGIPGLSPHTLDDMRNLHAVVHRVQEDLYEYAGSLDKVITDDKGTSVIAAFGLPPVGRQQRASRAVRAALQLQSSLWEAGVETSVGIASGKVICGPVGNSRRREYTIIGDTVNRAARLMQQAEGEILADRATWYSARGRVAFEKRPPVFLGGIGETVLYRAHSVKPYQEDPALAEQRPLPPIVGRKQELEQLLEHLETLVGGEAAAATVEGEAGVGKTRLCLELCRQASRRGARVYAGLGEQHVQDAPYHAWRDVFGGLFGVRGPASDGPETVEKKLHELKIDSATLPLLSAVLPLDLGDDVATRDLTGHSRADRLRELLVEILERSASRGPMVVLLEDAQWFDPSSWALLHALRQRNSALLLLVSRRVQPEILPPEADAFLADPEVERVQLRPLDRARTAELLRQTLGRSEIPPGLGDRIFGYTLGNPFFTYEYAVSVRERLNTEDRSLEEIAADLTPPDDVEAVVTERLDATTERAGLAFKVASVLQAHFDAEELHAIFPVKVHRDQIVEDLERLVAAELLERVHADGEPRFTFKQRLTREVVYGMLTPNQQRILHQRVAQRMEDSGRGWDPTQLPLLAHHWEQSRQYRKACACLEGAGDHALRTGAHREAQRLFQRALRLADRTEGVGSLEQGRWRRGLGDALFGLGRMDPSAEQLHAALTTLGYPVPRSLPGLGPALLRQLGWRLAVGLRVERLFQAGDSRREFLEEAARAAERLAERAYFLSEFGGMFRSSLHAANLGERAGPVSDVPRAFSFLGLLFGMAPVPFLSGLSGVYFRRARRLAAAVGDRVGLAYELQFRGILYDGLGRWDRCEAVLQRSLEIFRSIGNNQEVRIETTLLALAQMYRGRFERALELFEEVLSSARAGGNLQHEIWGLYASGECLARLGRYAEARSRLERAEELLDPEREPPSAIICAGVGAWLDAEEGRWDRARDNALRAVEIREALPTVFASLEGYSGAYEVLVRIVTGEAGASEAERERLRKPLRQAWWALVRFSLLFPLGRPRMRTLWALSWRRRGWNRLAALLLRRARVLARRLHMEFDYALATLEQSRLPQRPIEERRRLRREAGEIFDRLGCSLAYRLTLEPPSDEE